MESVARTGKSSDPHALEATPASRRTCLSYKPCRRQAVSRTPKNSRKTRAAFRGFAQIVRFGISRKLKSIVQVRRFPYATFSHFEGYVLRRSARLGGRIQCRAGTKLPETFYYGGGALPGRRSERRSGAHHHGGDVENARPVDGDRKRRRRWRHHRQRPGRCGGAGRLHPFGGQHGFARFGAGADAEHQVQFRT